MTDFRGNNFAQPIRQLDRVLINKIAAGEVIERPASVVKELVENSFDSGATAVDIVAEKSGTTYISVSDDGCGIPAEQVRLAFSRHATSKISDLDDLFAVQSYGFRGEALPSIASVSHLTMTTRHRDEKEGTRIVIEGGNEIECRPMAAPAGTKVEVSHLFFNTPARRKFLRSEATESRQIIRVAERMALGKPSVAVNLNLNQRKVFRLHRDQPTDERMASLFGIKDKSIVEYDVELGGVSYLVYLAHPDQARNDRTRICLFINGRSVTSPSLMHAVTSGYGEFLPAGRFPLATVFVTIDPQRLDVNVHPTKAEVRLSEERAIHDNLFRIVKKALRDWRLVPGVSQAPKGNFYPQQGSGLPSAGNFKSNNVPRNDPGLFKNRTRADNSVADAEAFQISREVYNPAACDNTQPVSETESYEPVRPEDVAEDEVNYLGKAGRLYLVVMIAGELYVIDQHAAHERVLYERCLDQVERGSAAAQKLLFPESIELSGEEFVTFESSREVLNKMGFEIEGFGSRAIIVNAIPPVFKNGNPSLIVREMLDDINQLNKAGGELIKSVAQSLACRASVMAGDRLSSEEVVSLIKRLFATNNPYCCPHGRPTFIKISQEELDGRFGRS